MGSILICGILWKASMMSKLLQLDDFSFKIKKERSTIYATP